ncbi:MAG: RICIN domain-containing protein [Kineosporiaceae bacterium]
MALRRLRQRLVNGDRATGSYVTLRAPSGGDWSSVIETVDASSPQTLTFTVGGGLSTGTVHVWWTDLRSSDPSQRFVKGADITPSGGSFSLTVQPGSVYSVTTTTGQGKGDAVSPPSGSLALPYKDNFNSYLLAPKKKQPNAVITGQAKYLMSHQGAFELVKCGGGRSGKCIRQMSEQAPIFWTTGHAEPYALLGDTGWRNYTVSSDVMFEKSGYAQLFGRAGSYPHDGPQSLSSYYLRVSDSGAWSLVSNSRGTPRALASGTVAALGTMTWHKLSLALAGTKLTATLDGATLATVTDASFASGQVGYGTGQGVTAQFDNLVVTPVEGGPAPTSFRLQGTGSGRCVEVPGASRTNGTQVALGDCGTGEQQKFSADGGQLVVYGSKCLDASGQGTTNGTKVVIWDCNGGANQQWDVNADGSVRGVQSGLCLDVNGQATAAGSPIQLWTCNGGTNQSWSRN